MSANLPHKSLSQFLKEYRRNKGLTQKALAKKWGYASETISAWERGKRGPSLQQQPRLAQLLGIEVEELAYAIALQHQQEDLSKNKAQKAEIPENLIDALFTVYANQSECENEISVLALKAKVVKILTVRGDKYFNGAKSILAHLYTSDTNEKPRIQMLVLSPESDHITDELAIELKHNSADEIREKMRIVFDYLKFLARHHEHFQIRYYTHAPNFKLLQFDDTMFISAFIRYKNDDTVRMIKITRDINPLFIGFERHFNYLWDNSQTP